MLEKTKEGRNINRHYYSRAEVKAEIKRPVVAALLKLLSFRNSEAAFDLDGTIDVTCPSSSEIVIKRQNKAKTRTAVLTANLKTNAYQVKVNDQLVTFE